MNWQQIHYYNSLPICDGACGQRIETAEPVHIEGYTYCQNCAESVKRVVPEPPPHGLAASLLPVRDLARFHPPARQWRANK